jgi:two-component system chemotaxis response regulator CheB
MPWAKDGRLVLIGGSAGAVEGLHRLILALPADFPAPICAVIHTGPRSPGLLASVIGRGAKVLVKFAEDGDSLVAGQVLIAPSDRHLHITGDGVALSLDAKENRSRPAIDPLFRTAAKLYGARCIGVILSGALDDGSLGLAAIKDAGGGAIVQSPGDALVPDMPRNALQRVAVDYAVPLDEIAPLLVRLARQPRVQVSGPVERELPTLLDPRTEGAPALLACPDCQGTLWMLGDQDLIEFKCRVGHSYSLDTLLEAQDESVERAIWASVRALEETAALTRRLEQDATARGNALSARHFRSRAEAAERNSATVRRVFEKEFSEPSNV